METTYKSYETGLSLHAISKNQFQIDISKNVRVSHCNFHYPKTIKINSFVIWKFANTAIT